MKESEHPPGFEPFRFNSPFLDLIGPVYSKSSDAGITVGLYIEERHCNRRDTAHGGVLTSLADITLGYSAGHGQVAVQLTTIALNIEFLGPAKIGRWVEWAGSVTKFGRSIAHANCIVTSDSRPIARATGMFRVHQLRNQASNASREHDASDSKHDRQHDDDGR